MSRTAIISLTLVVVGVLLITGSLILVHGGPAEATSSVSGASVSGDVSVPSSSASVAEPCTCLTEDDNGKMVSLIEGSFFTIELPANAYTKTSLRITPSSTLTEATSTIKPSATGRWVRTFEATAAGTVEITASSTKTNVSDFRLKVVISPRSPETAEVSVHSGYHFLGLF